MLPLTETLTHSTSQPTRVTPLLQAHFSTASSSTTAADCYSHHYPDKQADDHAGSQLQIEPNQRPFIAAHFNQAA